MKLISTFQTGQRRHSLWISPRSMDQYDVEGAIIVAAEPKPLYLDGSYVHFAESTRFRWVMNVGFLDDEHTFTSFKPELMDMDIMLYYTLLNTVPDEDPNIPGLYYVGDYIYHPRDYAKA